MRSSRRLGIYSGVKYFQWEKFNVVETTNYYWNKYNVNSSYSKLLGTAFYYSTSDTMSFTVTGSNYSTIYYSTSVSVNTSGQLALSNASSAIVGSNSFSTIAYTVNSSTYLSSNFAYYIGATNSFTYGSYNYANNGAGTSGATSTSWGLDLYYVTYSAPYYCAQRVYIDRTQSKGSTSYGTVNSTNSSAYPSNGISGSYWYVSSSSSISYSKGDISYGIVESKDEDAYPSNGKHTDGYWYTLIT